MIIRLYQNKQSLLGIEMEISGERITCEPEIVDLSDGDMYEVEHRLTLKSIPVCDWNIIHEIKGQAVYLIISTVEASRSKYSQWTIAVIDSDENSEVAYAENIAGDWRRERLTEFVNGEMMAAARSGGNLTITMTRIDDVASIYQNFGL